MQNQSRLARVSTLVAASFAFVAAGCDEPSRERGDRPTAAADAPIIDGSADTDHPAVVWLFDADHGAACSGTIVKVDGTTGYVLTAAHCADMDLIAITTDFYACLAEPPGEACEAVFAVEDQIYHPDWSGDVDTPDFSLIRFVGAGPSTPFIPVATGDDGVFPAVSIDVVGFGQTESGDNSRRNHKVTEIATVTTEPDLFSHPSTVCYGDSGGPAILDGHVVGVSSFVDSDSCRGRGYSARVESVYDDFIEPYLAQPPIELSCEACLETALTTIGGPCGDAIAACDADSACVAIEECVVGCVGNAGCESDCSRGDVAGAALHDAIFRCATCDICAASCGDDARCHEPSPTATTSAGPGSTGAGPISSDGTGGAGGGGTGADDGGDAADVDDGCAKIAPGPSSGGSGALAIGLALGALVARRRRA